MTSGREVRTRLQQLRDVREILSSMKNLAYMETRKLTPRLATQGEVVRLIEAAAADFLAHFPTVQSDSDGTPLEQTVVVIGSERGFCGAFNEQLRQALGETPARLLVVGRKLAARLESDARFRGAIDGAVVAEDAEGIIARLVEALGGDRGVALTLLFHDEQGEMRSLPLLPPFRNPPPRDRRPAPLLHVAPHEFYMELVEQYLFAVLHDVLFASLLAENQQRVRHLEGAVQRLEEQLGELERRRHRLRQEEITEEIEIILLNAEV